MVRTPSKTPARKAKKSFTLSADSVAFLEAMRRNRRAVSVSSVLEEILQEIRREQALAAVEQAMGDYYTSLSRAESQEQSTWGEFAMREFPKETV